MRILPTVNPYVGVTGFTKRSQVDEALTRVPEGSSYYLMVGVLVSGQSLRREAMPPEWQPLYPSPRQLSGLFSDDHRALNLLHYSGRPGKKNELVADIEAARLFGGPNCHGLQFNVTWPDPAVLEAYRLTYPTDTLVLKIGNKAMEAVNDDTGQLLRRLAEYDALTNRVLIDLSGGEGKALDPAWVQETISAIREQSWHWGFCLSAAGGLGPETLGLIEPLVRQLGVLLSFDAQRLLRNEQNELDSVLVRRYLERAYALVAV